MNKERTILYLFSINAIIYIASGFYTPFLSAYYAQKGIDAEKIGILLMIGPCVVLLTQRFWAKISDRTGKRKEVLLVTIVGSGFSMLLYYLGNSFLCMFFATVVVTSFTTEQIKEAEQYIQIDVQQPLYSMVDRGFEDLMSWGYDRGIDSMTYGSMGAGILSGKIRSVPSFEKNDLRLNFYDVYKEPKFSKIMELLKVMDSIADGHNVPVGQVALNWSTQKEYVGTALVGVRSIEHADENCKTFDWKLTEEEMKILDSKIEECAL